jgi:hypothetical protein
VAKIKERIADIGLPYQERVEGREPGRDSRFALVASNDEMTVRLSDARQRQGLDRQRSIKMTHGEGHHLATRSWVCLLNTCGS